MKHLFALATLGGISIVLACGPTPPPHSGLLCDGVDRPQLNCDSEFKYDGRNIQGGFSAMNLGGISAKTDETALRQIDKETEQYAAQSRRLCDEYNKCVIDKATYSTRAENMRRRMSKAPELLDEVKAAPDEESKRKALSKAYTTLVADENRRELSFDFSVEAQKPNESSPQAIGARASLPSGTRVAFLVRPSKAAHVYLFQRGPDGKVNVLFPDSRIAMKNPLPAGSTLRIPAGTQSFKLNDKDIGTEKVFIVASLDPLSSLSSAADTATPQGALRQVTDADQKSSKGCQRALELDEAPKCTRPRGLELDDAPAQGGGAPRAASFRAQTEAADSVIVQTFAFEHTP